jgi:hypothetical protein
MRPPIWGRCSITNCKPPVGLTCNNQNCPDGPTLNHTMQTTCQGQHAAMRTAHKGQHSITQCKPPAWAAMQQHHLSGPRLPIQADAQSSPIRASNRPSGLQHAYIRASHRLPKHQTAPSGLPLVHQELKQTLRPRCTLFPPPVPNAVKLKHVATPFEPFVIARSPAHSPHAKS